MVMVKMPGKDIADGAEKQSVPTKQDDEAPSNFARLHAILPDDSLAANLVSAYAEPGEHTPTEAVSKVIADRLDAQKNSYDSRED